MKSASNPFAPGAGTQPPELTGREENLSYAHVALQRTREGNPVRSSFLIGLRGVGKTVLLNRIYQLAQQEGYRSAYIETPEERPLAQLLVPELRKILLDLDLAAGSKEALRNAVSALRAFASTFEVKIGDVGIGVKPATGTADSGDLELDLTDLLVAVARAAKEAHTAIAICIDELQYIREKELAALLAGIHRIGQLNLPLILFGAGLPQLTGLSGKAKSYAERLFHFQMIGQLTESDAKKAIQEPIEKAHVEIDDYGLTAIIEATEGYPYFLQEWGYHAWEVSSGSPITSADIQKAGQMAIKALDESFFRVRFDRLTPGEKEYLRAMAELGKGPHRSGDIAKKLKRAVDSVATIRARVIAKGMVFAPSYGDNAFTVPKFDEYMRRAMPDFKPKPKKRRRTKS